MLIQFSKTNTGTCFLNLDLATRLFSEKLVKLRLKIDFFRRYMGISMLFLSLPFHMVYVFQSLILFSILFKVVPDIRLDKLF